jgi:hypothetical protein
MKKSSPALAGFFVFPIICSYILLYEKDITNTTTLVLAWM